VHLQAQHVTVKETEQALIKLVKFMNNLSVVIKSSKNDVIRMMLKTLFSNFLLKGRNLEYTWVSGLWGCCNEGLNQEWLGFCDVVRTDYHEDLMLLTQDLPSELLCNDQSH